jgi:hypothetical protein
LSSAAGNRRESPTRFKFSEIFQHPEKARLHSARVLAKDGCMIFRAVLGLALVALYLPHEPDLGTGRPGIGASLPATMNMPALPAASSEGSACDQHAQACARGLALLDAFQESAIRGLAEVKAEIDASRQARAANPS